MAATLALASAVVFGAGDFLGGVASRRMPAAAVVLRSNLVGLAGLLLALPLIDAATPGADDVTAGVLAGLAGGVGILLLYTGMAMGAMSVVAPLTAVLSAMVPMIVGIVSGERPSGTALVGVTVALLAIALVSREKVGDAHVTVEPRTLVMALGAGLAFGLFFVGLDAASDDVGLWPVVSSRSASVVMFAVIVALVRSARLGNGEARQGSTPALLLGCGVFDSSANALYLLATQQGLLTLVAVLSSLYPASTVLLARFVLGERLSRPQVAGVGLAGVAVALISAG